MEDSEIINKHLPTFKNHFFLNSKWSNLSSPAKTIFKLLPIFFILAAIPLTVNLSQQKQNVKQEAATTPSLTQPSMYGSAIGMDSLNNTQIGGGSNNSSSYRFLAETTSALNSIRIYIVDGSGYAGGNGGKMEVTVQTDDNSSGHFPSGTILASTTIQPGNPISIGYLPLITFPSPPSLAAGQLYHIVFRNTDSSPTSNFVSLDGVYMYHPTSPVQPRFNDVYWGQPVKSGSGSWANRNNTIPILQLNYTNGSTGGLGYMEVWARSSKSISGSSMAREKFTVSGGDKTVSSASVRLTRISGTSPLTVKLEKSDGTLVSQGTIASSSIAVGSSGDSGGAATWATYSFPSAQTLVTGQNYNLVFSTSSDTVYSIFSIERGNGYGFAPTTYFGDGYGQYTTNGSSWLGFDQPGGSSNNTNSDLQFYFQTSNSPSNPTPITSSPSPTNPATVTPTLSPKPTITPTSKPTVTPSPKLTNTPTPTPSTSFSITLGPTTGNISNTGATITWYLSDYGTGQVEYGITSQYGLVSIPETSFKWNYHVQPLSNLTPGTTYHYRVRSINKNGVTVISQDKTFVTTGTTATPTPKPTSMPNTPTPTHSVNQTPTPIPTKIVTPTPTPIRNSRCVRFFFWRYCFGN